MARHLFRSRARGALGVATVCLLSCASPNMLDRELPLSAQASRIVEWLQDGRVELVAAALHYPKHQSQAERELDMGGVADAVQFLLREFGIIEDASPLWEAVDAAEIGIFGGDLPYWSSLGTFESRDFLYAAEFRRLGSGLIKVSFFETGLGWETRAVAFGLPLSRTDAEQQIAELARRLAEYKGVLSHDG